MVKVYRFRLYNISADENEKSRRWGTREAIERIGGEVMEDTETEVDESDLVYDGMTDRNFNPHKLTGFQRQGPP
jgi:hypothetical protein